MESLSPLLQLTEEEQQLLLGRPPQHPTTPRGHEPSVEPYQPS